MRRLLRNLSSQKIWVKKHPPLLLFTLFPSLALDEWAFSKMPFFQLVIASWAMPSRRQHCIKSLFHLMMEISVRVFIFNIFGRWIVCVSLLLPSIARRKCNYEPTHFVLIKNSPDFKWLYLADRVRYAKLFIMYQAHVHTHNFIFEMSYLSSFEKDKAWEF